jgi:hypothetical protein
MTKIRIVQCGTVTLAAVVLFAWPVLNGRSSGSRALQNAELDPATLAYKLPSQIHWVDDAIGAKTAVLLGDPTKPGLYIELVKWTPHHMSHPHWHPNDRFITVLSGTWWVGTGTKFDPDRTVPMPAGSFVTHYGKHVHFDGAKDQEAVLEIVGEGPGTATPAETK